MFDLLVIGGGPGGYPAAIHAAQKGKKVALIEKNKLGGSCLNRGCIPSKALISEAKKFKIAQRFGVTTFDYSQMTAHKEQVVAKMLKGLEQLISANKIELIKGQGKFLSPKEVQVGDQILKADKIIIATGSEPRQLFDIDQIRVLDSTGLLELKKLPSSLAIIGGGIIGCEFASLFNTLGVKIKVIEMMDRILPQEAPIVSSALSRAFKAAGIEVITNAAVESTEKLQAELVLVAVGRSMNTKDIGLDKAGVKVDEKGNIPVNDKMETNVPGIYAVGDLASKWWLAHVATHQGLVAASNACGDVMRMHYNAIPSVIFTDPEIATCGLSMEEAEKQGFKTCVGYFPFQASGKAQATGKTEGFAQIVVEPSTGQILGAQVVGEDASTLIAEMALAIQNELTVECIAETIHAHPTLSECWMEAALIALKTPLHLPPK